MTTSYDLPMPGERYDGGTVVASVWQDDTSETTAALLLVLRPEAPFFEVAEIENGGGGWHTIASARHHNIVYAVRDYEENGGDV